MSDDERYEQSLEKASQSASATFFMQASTLRKNGHVVIPNRPCNIVEISSSRHKVHFVAVDIFTGKEFETTVAQGENMEAPNVTRNKYNIGDIDDGFLNLMSQDGVSKDDI